MKTNDGKTNNKHLKTKAMRTIETNVYEFNELSDAAKQVAINEYCGINTDYNWFESTYEDAENIGLQINGFRLERGTIEAELIYGVEKCCQLILEQHGETTEPYKLAVAAQKWIDDANKVSDKDFDDEMAIVEERFLNALKRIYIKMLQSEYTYLESDEAIIDTIEANDFEFYETGKKY